MFNYYYGYGGDPWLLVVLAVFVVSIFLQGSVMRTFRKFSQTPAAGGIPAEEMARRVLQAAGSSVAVGEVAGALTDHFNPKTGQVGLSEAVYGSSSVAALAVAAHEIGHVLQYHEGYGPIRFRNAVLPVARIGSYAAPWIILLGLFFSSYPMAVLGIGLYAAVLLFQLATLPVEFNASRRALEMLSSGGYISYDQEPQASKVLRAAAMTYVIAAVATFASILRFLSLINRRR